MSGTVIQSSTSISPRLQQADRFLVEAAGILASSLEYENTLAALAQLAVRSLADFCIIDVIEGGEVRRAQVAHADPDHAALTAELLQYPIDRNRPHLALTAMQTRRPVVVEQVTPEVLDSVSQDSRNRAVLEALRPRSLMAVPLLAKTRLVGVIVFVSSSHSYDADDLAVAEQLAALAGLEVDNARHYREARQALQARDRVLGIVAHDLRNPLNTIIIAAGLLQGMPLPAGEGNAKVDLILRAARRMNRLIQDLLDVAKIEADRFVLEREYQLPAKIAREAVDLSNAAASQKALSLSLETSDVTTPISVDHDRLLRVLTNLIDNAIKFTPEGGRIVVRVQQTDSDVQFAVADTGPGIAAEDLPRLFQPFWQARRKSIEGAGLGLAIARGIVEAHGGTIRAESVPGQGSTFQVNIPYRTSSGDRQRRNSDRRTQQSEAAR